MRKLLAIIPALLLLLIGVGSNALASDTTAALWSGIVRITNNSTAASVVSVNFTANTTVLIANGYMNSSGNNTSLQIGGADVAYMPGYAGSPWAVFAGSVGANTIIDGTLYMGGTTDMAGKIRYFPGTAGANVTDSASLELSNNGTVSFSGYVDTTAGASASVSKTDAFRIIPSSTISGNLTAEIYYGQTYATTANTTGGTNGVGTTHTINMPGGTTSGDLLIVLMTLSTDRTITFPSDNGTWTALYNVANGGALRHGAWYKVATGEGASIAVTLNLGSAGSYTSYRITGYSGTPEVGVTATGNDANPNPPNVATTWASNKNLFIATHGSADTSTTAYPVNYASGLTYGTATEGVTGSARRDLTATSDNPGTFTTTGVANWVSNTIVVKPANIAASVSGVSSGDMVVTAKSDGANFWLTAGSSVSANVTTAAVPDNANNWTFASGGSMPYMEYAEIKVGGTQKGYWEWEYAATFTDQSGNGNTMTPTFRTTSSDADVSAELISFSPIAEADAPAYTIDNPPDFITDNITVAGSFTSNTTSSTSPGVAVIVAVAAAGNTPVPFILYLLVGIVLVSLSFGISYLMRSGGSSSLVVKLLLLLGALGTGIAIGIIDDWVLYLFAMLGIGIAFIASNRQFEGTGNTGNNLFGFLIMSWLGLMVVNNILEGAILTEANKTSMNDFLIYQPWNVANWFVLPVPSIRFLTVGLPALMKWDYTVFGGNAQIFTYLMYSISGVVAFMFFTVAMGAAANMFFRSR